MVVLPSVTQHWSEAFGVANPIPACPHVMKNVCIARVDVCCALGNCAGVVCVLEPQIKDPCYAVCCQFVGWLSVKRLLFIMDIIYLLSFVLL